MACVEPEQATKQACEDQVEDAMEENFESIGGFRLLVGYGCLRTPISASVFHSKAPYTLQANGTTLQANETGSLATPGTPGSAQSFLRGQSKGERASQDDWLRPLRGRQRQRLVCVSGQTAQTKILQTAQPVPSSLVIRQIAPDPGFSGVPRLRSGAVAGRSPRFPTAPLPAGPRPSGAVPALSARIVPRPAVPSPSVRR